LTKDSQPTATAPPNWISGCQLLATMRSLLLLQPDDRRDFLAARTAGNVRLCPQCGISVLIRT
jgi:hypothetical protein